MITEPPCPEPRGWLCGGNDVSNESSPCDSGSGSGARGTSTVLPEEKTAGRGSTDWCTIGLKPPSDTL